MRCFTIEEAQALFKPWLDASGKPERGGPGWISGRFSFGDESLRSVYWVAARLVDGVGPWENAWLWLDRPDTWNRPGLHLYERLRHSYGDLRTLPEAPVHQFQGYEEADLRTFVAAALLNEWQFSLFTSHDYGRLFVSQSSRAELWLKDPIALRAFSETLASRGMVLSTDHM